MINKTFWDCVKRLVNINKVDLKPCQYYSKNKEIVHTEYKKTKLNKKNIKDDSNIFGPGYQNIPKPK